MKLYIILLAGLIACGGDEPAPSAIDKGLKVAPAKAPQPAGAVPQAGPPPSGDDGPPAEAVAVGDDSECGQELKDYEAFVDEYIEYMEKVSAGDLSAMAKAGEIMAKSDSASQEIINLQASGDFDIPCFQKYQEINNRMTTAALEMSGASEEDKAEIEEMQEATNEALNSLGCLEACQTETDPMTQLSCIQDCQ